MILRERKKKERERELLLHDVNPHTHTHKKTFTWFDHIEVSSGLNPESFHFSLINKSHSPHIIN